jgi:hypothetical protein
MNRKPITRIVVLSLALTLCVSFLGTQAVAQTRESRDAGGRVQPDIPGLLTQAIAQGLTAQGHEVNLDGNTVAFATPAGELILDFPATQEALERGEFTISKDGHVVQVENTSTPYLTQLDHAKGGIGDVVGCIHASVDIFGTCLDICEFSTGSELFCSVECTFSLVLNALRCVED